MIKNKNKNENKSFFKLYFTSSITSLLSRNGEKVDVHFRQRPQHNLVNVVVVLCCEIVFMLNMKLKIPRHVVVECSVPHYH